ncbi:sporulation integral membrane protein YtvI [Caldibacillus lycopersici]|uniref:Sporulation integral membrane protein YtvI n=1 Tax=Perspicuibacillus lycopersici TaxID=1325689 RepID=A0AAE3LNT3_9BACI|nr:sporulation integral membrane protein YtvI [Perspicuibacillus lycopersici]MCU9614187.1 sporulation integral membrane protein YtvI [Perspicuibacillus lycopersici]
MNSIYFQRFFRSIIVVGGTFFLLVAVYYISSVVYPFIFAWIIAFLMNPLVNFLQFKGKLPRPLAVLLILIIIFALIASLLTLLIFEIISGAEYLAKNSPDQIQALVDSIQNWITGTVNPFINQLTNIFFNLGEEQQQTIITNIQEIGSHLATTVAGFMQTLLTKLPGFISWFPNAATVLIFTILATFFISNDWYRLKHFAGKFLPNKVKQSSMNVYIDLRKAFFGFIVAQLTLISITFVIVFIGLLIIRVDYALALSFIIAIIDLLPYLGTGLIFVPWIIYQFLVGNFPVAVGLSVLYIVVIVQRQLMEPKVVSTNIGITPLTSLISIFVGLQIFGFSGLIIGPIIAVVIVTLFRTGVFTDLWHFIKGKDAIE